MSDVNTYKMLEAIEEYCEEADCLDNGFSNCKIADLCAVCEGKFEDNREIAKEAYEVIKLTPKVDMVNHPTHYETGKFECIDVMEEIFGKEYLKGFCICNSFKYLYRHKRKNGIEDINKAQWYLNKYKELVDSEFE